MANHVGGLPPTMNDYPAEIDALKETLVMMGGHAESAVSKAVAAVMDRNEVLARQVQADDRILDQLDDRIETAAVQLLAKTSSVDELRLITVAMKISQNLERVGDEAVTIANRAIELNAEPQLRPHVEIPQMARLSTEMLREALGAFVAKESDRARAALPRESTIAELNQELQRELVQYLVSRPATITRSFRIMTVSKSLESIADHATRIAEDVVSLYEPESSRTVRDDEGLA